MLEKLKTKINKFEVFTEVKQRGKKEDTFQTPSFINQKRNSSFKINSVSTYYKSNVQGKGPWTEEEDKLLIDLVEKHGAERWSFISSFFPERIGKQCRERWFNHLNPEVKKSTWLKEEEWILYLMHNQYGNKWSKLCKYLPGRTDNTIKNHWNSTMQKKIDLFKNEFNSMTEGKSIDEIESLKLSLIQQCQDIIKNDNQKYYFEKQKNYEKFKNSRSDNKLMLSKLKKILLFRTHSKKTKKKGRKKKIFIKTYIDNKIQNKEIQKNKNIIVNKNNFNIIISKNILNNTILSTPNKTISNKLNSYQVSPILNDYDKFNSNSSKIFYFNPLMSSSNIKKDYIYSNFNIEKSAFNKKIYTSDINCSNIKTHLLFSSSIKKPIKIVSEDYNYGYNNENLTPNKPFVINPNFESLNKSISIKNSQPHFDANISQTVKTPCKIRNTNLDKLFFSVINKDYENTSNKK